LLFDGRLIVAAPVKKTKRQIADIISWSEAFSIYALILCTYFPHRWIDLCKYKLLILRTYRQFGGLGWLSYDKEFREQAAAERLTDWSAMNVQVYNFNTAGAQVRPRLFTPSPDAEATSHTSESVLCISWNAGRCVAKSPKSPKCDGDHRGRDCTRSSYGYNRRRARSLQPEDTKRKKTH